jgi:hypothetical protein
VEDTAQSRLLEDLHLEIVPYTRLRGAVSSVGRAGDF